MSRSNTSKLSLMVAYSAVIAALYAVLTIFATIPVSNVQLRISEALCVLPIFTPAAVPGLFIGCVISNIVLGSVMLDVVFGSMATLLAAVMTYYIGRKLPKKASVALAPLPAVVFNALIVGAILIVAYGAPFPYPLSAAYVAAGQVATCYGLGLPLALALSKAKLPKGFEA